MQKPKSNGALFRYLMASVLVTSIALGATTNLFGQNDNTVHVFPQIVDGRLSDGTVYRSAVIATNLSPLSADCTLSTTGIPMDRFTGPGSFTLKEGDMQLNITAGANPLVSGYATLTCSQPVQASLIYRSSTPGGLTSGMATVFSAPRATYAGIPLLSGASVRVGLAVANTAGAPIMVNFLLKFDDGTTNGKAVQIPANSQMVRFIDELVDVPAGTSPTNFEMSSASPFFVTGLLFDGTVFTTLVPAILP